MGCDIHCYLERFDKSENRWISCSFFDEEQRLFPVYSNRDYALFSILANVRNGNRFVNGKLVKFIPIDYPRGLPNDVSELVLAEYEKYKEDYHSESYLLVSELYEAKKLSKTNKEVLKPLIRNIKAFADCNYYISDKFKNEAKNYRIVFWFDS